MNIVDVYQQDISQFAFQIFLESFPRVDILNMTPVVFLIDDENNVLGMSTVRDYSIGNQHYKEIFVKVAAPARSRVITQETSLLNSAYNILKTRHTGTFTGAIVKPVNSKVTKQFLENFSFFRKMPTSAADSFLYATVIYERSF